MPGPRALKRATDVASYWVEPCAIIILKDFYNI